MTFRRSTLALALVVFAVLSVGCHSDNEYIRNRSLDAADIFDLKYGCNWDSFGIGLKAEVTNYLGAGLGIGHYSMVHEQYGRYLHSAPYEFMHMGFYGLDGSETTGTAAGDTEYLALIFNCCQPVRPPVIDRFRVGGEVLLLGLVGGFYLNLGEMVDFFPGLFEADPAGDDGLPDDSAWW